MIERPQSETDGAAPPLSGSDRALGRRLAISSHPAGMTFSMVFTQHLPTLLLVSLRATEAQVGLQQAFLPGLQLLQLPTLRAIAHTRKRTILLGGQVFALVVALPILAYPQLVEWTPDWSVIAVLISFALVAAGLNIGNTVWFPMLRSYVEPLRIGHFFGLLRSGWHLALILYYIGAQLWLARHPGDFAPLFGVAWLLGLLRIALIAKLPERSERTGDKIRVREAIALVRDQPDLRRYLLGVASNAALRHSALPFAIVMMRREVGFDDGQLIIATAASYLGGLVSLYLWGRITDRAGAAPVFRITSLGLAATTAVLLWIDAPTTAGFAWMLAFFFFHSVLSAGFGVADTHVLFRLTPPEAPARMLVIAGVLVAAISALAPLIAGIAIEIALESATDALSVYRSFFAFVLLAQLVVFLPLRSFTRDHHAAEVG